MKKIIAFISAAAIWAAMCCIPRSKAGCAEEPSYIYTIINNEATITGFSGEPVYIEIPEIIEGCRVTEIRDNAFYECGSLRHISIPENVRKIGHHAFYACFSLESVAIPATVEEIGMGCFCGCSALGSVSLPDTISALPESCFRACTSLTTVTVPDSVISVGDFCFSGCTSLKDVSLGKNVSSLGDCSFYMCSSLSGLYIPPSVKTVGIGAVGYIPTETGAVPIEDFTVLGAEDSAAHKYAKDNNISFTDVSDSVHAFAIRRITGERVPISIPSVFVFAGAVVLIFTAAKFAGLRHRKNKRKPPIG